MNKQWNFNLSCLSYLCLVFLLFFSSNVKAENLLQAVEEAQQKIIQKISPSTVVILARSSQHTRERKHPSLMTGIVLDREGHILTFGKTFSKKDSLTIRTFQGEKFSATIIACDSLSRLTILKSSQTKGLVPITWGDSEKIKRGSLIWTMGNPFGLLFSSGSGQVSGINRIIEMGGLLFPKMIQITAPIHPGDVGGLVANRKGELIGIMATSYSQTYPDAQIEVMRKMMIKLFKNPKLVEKVLPQSRQRSGTSIGFVLPSNFLKRASQNLIQKGSLRWGRLGIKVIIQDKKIFIEHVVLGGPADKGGLKKGDLVLRYNTYKMERLYQFKTLVRFSEPGKKANILVQRGDKKQTCHPLIGVFVYKKKRTLKNN